MWNIFAPKMYAIRQISVLLSELVVMNEFKVKLVGYFLLDFKCFPQWLKKVKKIVLTFFVVKSNWKVIWIFHHFSILISMIFCLQKYCVFQRWLASEFVRYVAFLMYDTNLGLNSGDIFIYWEIYSYLQSTVKCS